MMEMAKLLCFVAVLMMAARIGGRSDAEGRKRRVVQFLAVFFALILAAGLLQIEAWPFTKYLMIMYVGNSDVEIEEIVIRAVDDRGVERRIDPLSWSPLFPTALATWIERRMPQLDSRSRDVALAFLLSRAEQSRRRLADRKEVGSARWLGALAAPPDWGVYRRAPAIPGTYRGLRIYRTRWRPANPRKSWTLLAEYEAR